MSKDIIVVGAGGLGRETLDVIDAINAEGTAPTWRPRVFDDNASAENIARLGRRGVELAGTTRHALDGDPAAYVVAIGNPQVRRRLADLFDAHGFEAVSLLHPSATFGFDVQIGAGTIVCAGARVTTNIRLGRHVHINPNVTIGHDTTLGDFVSANPQAAISGDCVIEDEVLVGVSGVVLNQLRVGRGAVVGGAACVVQDVPERAVVKGVPAR